MTQSMFTSWRTNKVLTSTINEPITKLETSRKHQADPITNLVNWHFWLRVVIAAVIFLAQRHTLACINHVE